MHIWLGMLAGLIFFMICLSGTVAMFRMEIVKWQNSLLVNSPVTSGCALNADQAFRELNEQLSGSPPRRLSLPALTGGFYELRLQDGRRLKLFGCEPILVEESTGIGDYLVNLHTRLFVGDAGRWVVGALGILMLLSIISGVLAHRKLFSRFAASIVQMRWRGHSRRRISDAHKLLGLWLIPFHLMIAGTGAWLGLISLVDTDGGSREQQVMQVPPFATPPALMPLLTIAKENLPDIQPVFIDFFPDRGHISIRGNIRHALVRRHSAEVLFSGSQGSVLSVHDPRELPATSWLAQTMMPLHVGDWRGLGVKVVYAVLGLGATLMIAFGLWLWGNRRMQTAGNWFPAGTQAHDALLAGMATIVLVSIVPPFLTGASARLYQGLGWPGFFTSLTALSWFVYLCLRLRRWPFKDRTIQTGTSN
ncbi:MAG: PepSY-associated TM helix domain-containing protein [Marinobacter sp.]